MIDIDKAPFGALLLRVSLGVLFLLHGAYLKAFVFGMAGTGEFFASMGLPAWFAWIVVSYESLGGLALMILPFMTAVIRDVFSLVPGVVKEAAYGLGGTSAEVVRYVVLPYTRTGGIGGVPVDVSIAEEVREILVASSDGRMVSACGAPLTGSRKWLPVRDCQLVSRLPLLIPRKTLPSLSLPPLVLFRSPAT